MCRVSSNDRNSSNLRLSYSLSERPWHTYCSGLHRCCKTSRAGWCWLCNTSLWNYKKDNWSDQKRRQKDEHRKSWRKPCICMDVHDRKRESFLWILWWNRRNLQRIWRNNKPWRRLPSRMSSWRNRWMPDWGAHHARRTDRESLEARRTGNGRRPRTCANGSDCSKHEDSADNL